MDLRNTRLSGRKAFAFRTGSRDGFCAQDLLQESPFNRYVSRHRSYRHGLSTAGGVVNYAALFQSALVALLRNKMRSILTVLGITIGIAAVICVVAIGKAGQARVEQQLNNLGDNFVWIEAGGRAINGVM